MKIIHRSIHTRRLSTGSSSRSYSKKINSARTIHVVIRQSKQSKKTTTSPTNSSKCQPVSDQCSSAVHSSGWPDWTAFERDHRQHKVEKRKKVCSTKLITCIVMIAFLVLMLITAAILIFLLRKPRKMKPEAILRWNQTGITVAGISGQAGLAANRLTSPKGVTLDWSHSIYVADSGNNRVQYYPRGNLSGITVCGQSNGASGSDAYHLFNPWKVMVENEGDIYVVDRNNHRIQLWKFNSSFGSTIAGLGVLGSNASQLSTPEDIFRDEKSGALYIADTYNHRVMRYFRNESTGTVIAGGNGQGNSNIQLSVPTGIRFGVSRDTLLIVNYASNNIVQWKIGDRNRTVFTGNINGIAGSTSTQLFGPECLVTDPMGNLYVADRYNHRIQFFLLQQPNGTTIAGKTGISGSNSTLLYQPFDVALDTQLNLYVADTLNHRIQKFLRY